MIGEVQDFPGIGNVQNNIVLHHLSFSCLMLSDFPGKDGWESHSQKGW